VYTPIEDPTGHAFDAFGAALDRARTHAGQARIAAWGASHTAADLYTGTIRRVLQSAYGDAGHGFIVAGRPWKFFRQSDVNLAASDGWLVDRVDKADALTDGRYGIAGVSVRSASPADFTRAGTTRDNAVGRRASTVEAWFLHQPDGGSFDVFVDGRRARVVPTAAANHAPGYATFAVPDRGHVVEVRPRGDGEVRLFGLVLERTVPGVILDTLGIPGSRAETLLKWDHAIFRHQVERRRPDLVILAYGTNEAGDDDVPIAEYETRLQEVVTEVRTAAPQASCLLIGPTDRPLETPDRRFVPRPRRAEVTGVQRRIAFDRGCAFFDPAAMMGGEGGMVQWVRAVPPLASGDHVHLTPAGYEIMGQMLVRELMLRAGQASRKTP